MIGREYPSQSGGGTTKSGGTFAHYGKGKKKKKYDDEEIEEITVTGDVDGYNTPFAFSDKKRKKQTKKGLKAYGYELVKEELDNKDLKVIKELIRSVIADVLRDIWLKRTVWK